MANSLIKNTAFPGGEIAPPFLTLGAMMFGKRADEVESRRICDAALYHGLNFFDTASMYQAGLSEQILGRALKGRRAQCLVATKVGYLPVDGAEEGISRASIFRCIDRSLQNLGMDYVDIFYLHRPDKTPIEETLEAMDEVIRSGKARYWGVSNFGAWRTLEMLQICKERGWRKPVVAQMLYNPLMRQLDIEFMAFAKKYGMYVTTYNPLAGGLLTGKYAGLEDREKGGRFVNNPAYERRFWTRRMFEGMAGLKAIADAEGLSLTHLTLLYIAQTGKMDNILLGPSSADQLLDCLAAGEKTLSPEAVQKINAFLLDFEGSDIAYAR